MNININQFEQTPVRGQLDLQITKSGVLSGVISASQATVLTAGSPVKLDTTTGRVPSFVAAADSDVKFGVLMYDVKISSAVAGTYVQVALCIPGPVMWLEAGAAIAAGAMVEDGTSDDVVTKASAKQIGVAIDPAATGELTRVILFTSAQG